MTDTDEIVAYTLSYKNKVYASSSKQSENTIRIVYICIQVTALKAIGKSKLMKTNLQKVTKKLPDEPYKQNARPGAEENLD